MNKYRKRIADVLLAEKLSYMGAVLVQGAKWCGKTTTSEQLAKSVFYMGDPEHHEENLTLAKVNPKAVLSGDSPHLIDEWQEAPALWDAVRFAVDHRKGYGQFILTGSAVPPEADFRCRRLGGLVSESAVQNAAADDRNALFHGPFHCNSCAGHRPRRPCGRSQNIRSAV